MLGSVHDADDALQETLLRAWRGRAGLREDRAARSWLYAIATNVCLTEIERRRKRVLPHDFGPAAEAAEPPGRPVTESVWLEPYPDAAIGVADGRATPEAIYEQREAIELAFVAALQHLSTNQRAALILRDVLGFSAQETAGMLATSVASITSSLQRARVAVAQRVPARTQQATLRVLGDDGLRNLIDRYVTAWETCDVAAFAALLTEDATFAMPPLATWYTPRAAILQWARTSSMSGEWLWKVVRTQANGQPALGYYTWDETRSAYLPFALNVLTLRDHRVSNVTAFIVRATDAPDDGSYQRYPELPFDEQRLTGTFGRFGLSAQLTD